MKPWHDPINQLAFFMLMAIPADDMFIIGIMALETPAEYPAWVKPLAVILAFVMDFYILRAFLRWKFKVVSLK